MLRIRLSRSGRRHTPTYRIVVAEHTAPIKGKHVEVLGYLDRSKKIEPIKIDGERYKYWLSQGAKPTIRVASLFDKLTAAANG